MSSAGPVRHGVLLYVPAAFFSRFQHFPQPFIQQRPASGLAVKGTLLPVTAQQQSLSCCSGHFPGVGGVAFSLDRFCRLAAARACQMAPYRLLNSSSSACRAGFIKVPRAQPEAACHPAEPPQQVVFLFHVSFTLARWIIVGGGSHSADRWRADIVSAIPEMDAARHAEAVTVIPKSAADENRFTVVINKQRSPFRQNWKLLPPARYNRHIPLSMLPKRRWLQNICASRPR